jgi:hypothetical protein
MDRTQTSLIHHSKIPRPKDRIEVYQPVCRTSSAGHSWGPVAASTRR